MAERTDRQAQIDPWAKVEYERGLMGDTPSVQYDRRDLVDAARAADAAQIASLTAQVEQQAEKLEFVNFNHVSNYFVANYFMRLH